VKVRIKFRGREITYPQIARQDLMDIAKELSDVAVVEQMPDLEGRTMLMVLGPNPRRVKPVEKKPEAEAAAANSENSDTA
jgi:translation initiation factor IF-3